MNYRLFSGAGGRGGGSAASDWTLQWVFQASLCKRNQWAPLEPWIRVRLCCRNIHYEARDIVSKKKDKFVVIEAFRQNQWSIVLHRF